MQLDGKVQQALNTAFMKEALDPNWAFEPETAIETQLSDAAVEEMLSLISRNCRTNQCRITYLGDNTQAHSVFGPSHYEFTNMRDCNWNYVTSYGGRWGVQHLYKASGSCPFSEQKVNFTQGGGYNNTVVYHR